MRSQPVNPRSSVVRSGIVRPAAGIALALGLSALSACSPSTPTPAPAPTPSPAASAPAPGTAPAPAGTALSAAAPAEAIKLLEAGKLTVCSHVAFKPFEFKDATGKTVGFDIDFAELVAKKLGATMQIVDIDFPLQTSGAVFAARKCDISISGTTITDKRREAVAFSVPYFSATQALLVKAGSSITDMSGFKGKKVGVQNDTTGQEYARKHANAKDYEIVVFDDLPTLLNGLKAGRIDGAINDNGVMLDFARDNKDTMVVAEFPTGEAYGFAVQKDNANASRLLDVVNGVIKASLTDGSYQRIYKTWFGVEPKTLPDVSR